MGDEGKMYETRLLPESRQAAYGRPPQKLERSPGHYVEWIQACKTGSPTGTHFGYSGPLSETVLLGTVAYRTGQKLEWDAEKMQATGEDGAAGWIRREYRKGWSL